MYTVSQIKKVLLDETLATQEEFDQYKKEAEKTNAYLLDYLINKKVVEEEDIYRMLALVVNKPFINLRDMKISQSTLFLIPEQIAQTHKVIAFEKTAKGVLKIATVDPDDIVTFEFIEKKNNMQVQIYMTTPASIRQVLRFYYKGLKDEIKDLADASFSDQKKVKKESLEKLASDLPIVHIIESILEYAVFEGASDIHIEPEEKEIIVRYRIDGILKEVMSLPRSTLPGILARIKILSNLKLDEHRLPQDGRFKIDAKNKKISFRVSTIPVFDGEKIVMRLLDESNLFLNLEDLGFRASILMKVRAAIAHAHGMILVTGPTGSGKTTSLYAILNRLNSPEVNIVTIEDPIEYRVPHINQSQVNPKINFTFANGLRALLRQDPDIIMVGEIRDKETVSIAIHASMTGHKVISTLHTTDAAGAIPRLLDMGVVPFLITSTLNIVMAQRLVRVICPYCIMSFTLDKKIVKDLSEQLDINSFLNLMYKEGVIEEGQKNIEELLFFKGKGCEKCMDIGYKGRVGLYEILEMTEEIKRLVVSKANAARIKEEARRHGMTTMLEDGLIKAKNGITTIEEVLRATRE